MTLYRDSEKSQAEFAVLYQHSHLNRVPHQTGMVHVDYSNN